MLRYRGNCTIFQRSCRVFYVLRVQSFKNDYFYFSHTASHTSQPLLLVSVDIISESTGFEQSYPSIRILLKCGHISFSFAPYGQLCHAVAQGRGGEPRCCVLLHVHGEMTQAAQQPLRCDLAGVAGCKGCQPFAWHGQERDGGMGFEQCKSQKSIARNTMEMALRRLPMSADAATSQALPLLGMQPEDDAPHPTGAELRTLWVKLCRNGMTSDAAPLLGDVVLVTYMSGDLRKELGSDGEAAVKRAFVSDLKRRLQASGCCDWRACLKYVNHVW